MRFRRDAPSLLIAAATAVLVLTGVVSNWLFSGLTTRVEESQFDAMEAILAFNLEGAESKALARAEMVADLPATAKLLAAQDRAGLLAEYAAAFHTQHEKHGVDQMQFHLPPATSFLRLHAPENYGDDLAASRPLVVAVNQEHIPMKAASIAFSGPAIFGITPVADAQGNHVGSFEVGIAFGPLLDNLKLAYGLELTLFVQEDLLNPEGVPSEVFGDQNRLGKYLKYHSTHWDLMQQLVIANDVARVEEPIRYTRTAFDVPYGVLLVPLRNHSGVPIGIIAVAKDFGPSRAAAGQSLVWQTLLALFGIVTLAGATIVVLRGFFVRPLQMISTRFGQLADGEPGDPIAETDMLCEELRELAAQHERLRSKEGGAA
ncbi:MAG TPA: cache domain-containing protein [Nannocystaceae bacterium]|nr:cache domain-containing protein [Nannocystaceae bacterium]